MRVRRTVHGNGEISLRLTPEHADALLSALTWMDPEQAVASGNRSSFDNTKLVDIHNARLREGRASFPSENVA